MPIALPIRPSNHRLAMLAVSGVIAGVLCLGAFLVEGTLGFNLADEGYLWYGAQRVVQGELPLRDFQAYDPGRYFWSAMIMGLRGDAGLRSLWISTALFQFIGLGIALWSLRRWGARTGMTWLLAVAAVLLLWMIPRHKTFDVTVSIALVAVLAWLIERPDARRHFIAGLSLGIAALINRNHGMYGLVAQAAAVLLMRSRSEAPTLSRALIHWGAGIVVGYSPVLLMLVFAPDFAPAFFESIRYIVDLAVASKNTNLPLPVPWPWRARFGESLAFPVWRAFVTGLWFVALVVFAGLGTIRVFWRRRESAGANPLIVSGSLMAVPYAHHAFSRAEILHLAQGAFPMLLAVFAWMSRRDGLTRWIAWAGLACASLVAALPAHPGFQRASEGNWVEARIGADLLWVNPATAHNVATFEALRARLAPGGGLFLTMPHWPGAYAVAAQRSPAMEIYSLFPSSPAAERAELERLGKADIRFVILQDVDVDGRDDLRFRNTHPLLQRYVDERFQKVASPFADPSLAVYIRRVQAP